MTGCTPRFPVNLPTPEFPLISFRTRGEGGSSDKLAYSEPVVRADEVTETGTLRPNQEGTQRCSGELRIR